MKHLLLRVCGNTSGAIKFVLIVDDFGAEYVGKQHTEHLANVIQKYHEISQDWEGKIVLT